MASRNDWAPSLRRSRTSRRSFASCGQRGLHECLPLSSSSVESGGGDRPGDRSCLGGGGVGVGAAAAVAVVAAVVVVLVAAAVDADVDDAGRSGVAVATTAGDCCIMTGVGTAVWYVTMARGASTISRTKRLGQGRLVVDRLVSRHVAVCPQKCPGVPGSS